MLVKLAAGHIYTDLYVKPMDNCIDRRIPAIHTGLVFKSEECVNEKMTKKRIMEPSKLSLEDTVTAVHSLRTSYRKLTSLKGLSCYVIQMKAKKLQTEFC